MSIAKSKNFDCVAAAEHLHEYLDGELKPEWRAAMEQHFASCADCTATLAQLRQIETAHQRLDARLESPAEEYWQTLPQRVMEKVKASEKRRLLALPKLPRLKSPAKQTPAHEQTPQNELLYLSSAVRKFLRSARYILPLAAVAAFCFFLIRELREKPEASMTMTSIPQQQIVDAQSARKQSVLEKSKAAPAPIATDEAPTRKNLADASAFQASVDKKEAGQADTLLATVGRVAASGQGTGLASTMEAERSLSAGAPAVPPQSEESISTALFRKTEVEVVSLQDSQRFSESFSHTKNQPVAPTENFVINYQRQTSDPEIVSRDDRSAKSQATSAKKLSLMDVRSSDNLADQRYAETLQRAQQTAGFKKRENIWRRFLASKPDSAHHALAITQLAQTLAAASDSASTVEQLTQTVEFFRENAAVLRSQLGAETFAGELGRLEKLLVMRKSTSPH
jgi:hypothetical protein